MVSVIVCTYNREKYLPECLHHLAKQSANPKDYEILIVDNNSSDDTAQITKDFIENNEKLNAKYILETNQGLTIARNRGIKEAEGDLLSFIDDDAFVKTHFITNIQQYFDDHKQVKAIGGKIDAVYEGEAPKWMSKYLLTLVSALDMGKYPKKFTGSKFPIGANMAFRTSVFRKYGDFDISLGRRGSELEGGEEKEMFLRLKNANEEIHYVPGVKVDHIIPEKRLQIDYIKGLGHGVGSSEKRRVFKAGLKEQIKKIITELMKFGGTFILFFIYLLKGKVHAANMLIKFRIWVISGFFK